MATIKSLEEKAKAYDDLLVKLQEAKVDNNVCDDRYCCVIDVIVPELKESEDEKMIQYFKDLAPFDKAEELYDKYGFSHKDAIAWLEEQGEHANFRNKIQIGDKVTRNEDGILVNLSQLNRVAKKDEKQGEQKPAAWSDDELDSITAAINNLEYLKNNYAYHQMGLEPAITFLKSLKERYTWKPSDEQMIALKCAITTADEKWVCMNTKDLESLYEDLKKLKA